MDDRQKAILSAIKKDDLAAFKKAMDKESERYSFGRFPLLSLCYLYGSRKIAFAYEKRLLTISRYTQIEEDREGYRLFRQAAKRVLRLYVGGRIVSPLVVLAVTGRHDALRALYPAAYKDVAIRSDISYAMNVLYGSDVSFGRNSIKIRRPHLPMWKAVTSSVAGAVALVMLVCCLVGYFVMPKDKGTAEDPVMISNEKQISFMFEREGYFSLASDIDVEMKEEEVFKASLDGNGKTMKFSSNRQAAFSELTGTIKNTVIEIDVGAKQIAEDAAFFARKNSGSLENVTFVVSGSLFVKDSEKTSDDEDNTVNISCVVGENDGTIKNCRVVCSVSAENEATRNAFLSAMVSKNNGTVTQCLSSGEITTDTVDISGLVGDNNASGILSSCDSQISLVQTTEKGRWSPNIGGLCLHNYGTLSSCRFSGRINGELNAGSEGMLCSDRQESKIDSAFLTVDYCECNVFAPGSTTDLTKHGAAGLSSSIETFNSLSKMFASFASSGSTYIYQSFFSYAQTLFNEAQGSIPKEAAYDIYSGAVVVLNAQSFFTLRESGRSYDDFMAATARLFGYSSVESFSARVSALIQAYASVDERVGSNKLLYDGAVYTSNGSLVFPFAFKNDKSSVLLSYVILNSSGNMYIWFSSVDDLFSVVNYDNVLGLTDENPAQVTVQGRCLLFESPGSVIASGIATLNDGTIADCTFDGKIEGAAKDNSMYLGGVAAINYNEIQGCVYAGEAEGTVGSSYAAVGGIVGMNTYEAESNKLVSVGKVKKSTSTGTITIKKAENAGVNWSERHIGGLVGLSSGGGVADGESSTEIVSDSPSSFVGGAVGVSLDKQSVYSLDQEVGVYTTSSKAKITIGFDSTAGGLIGYSETYIAGCEVETEITADKESVVGGAVGRNQTYTMENVEVKAVLNVEDDSYVGGIVGIARSTIKNCAATVSMVCGNGCTAGGIAAIDTSTVTSCTVDICLTAGDGVVVGGGVGSSSYLLSDCVIVTELSVGENGVLGGIVGTNSGAVYKSYCSGNLTAGQGSIVGGLIGKNEKGGVKYDFSDITITASGTVGSLIGQVDKDSAEGTLTYKEKFIEMYGAQLQNNSNAEAIIENNYAKYGYYYRNSYVKQDGVDAYGVIDEYDKEVSPEAYEMEATSYESETEMKNSNTYKEVFGGETEQDNNSVSGNNGGGSAL